MPYREPLLQKCKTLQKLVMKRTKQHKSFHKYLRSLLIVHAQSLPNDIVMVSFLSQTDNSLITTLHKICDEIPSSIFCDDKNDLSKYFFNATKSSNTISSAQIKSDLKRIQKLIDTFFPKSDSVIAPPPFSDKEFSIEKQDLIIVHDLTMWRAQGKDIMKHSKNNTWAEFAHVLKNNAVITEVYDHIEKIGINRNFMGMNPSSDVLSFLFRTWDGLYRPLECFIQKHEWRCSLPPELSSIFRFLSPDDVGICYSYFKKMYSFETKPFTDYLYNFQKEFYSYKLQHLSSSSQYHHNKHTYSCHFPFYMYYDFFFGSSPLLTPKNPLLCDIHGNPSTYFKDSFHKYLFPVRGGNHSFDWMWKNDSESIYLNIMDTSSKKNVTPSVYISRVHKVFPGWTFFRNGDVRFFFNSNHKILSIHCAQMNWRSYPCKDMDVAGITMFCAQKLQNGCRWWFKENNVFQSLLEKRIPELRIGELLDRCTEAQLILDPQSPFFIYFHEQQNTESVYSLIVDILDKPSDPVTPFFDDNKRPDSVRRMQQSFMSWDLLSPQFQSYIIKIWNVDACIESYQQFFMKNRDSLIFSDDFRLLPSDLDWTRMLRSDTDVSASSYRLLQPSLFYQYKQNTVLRKHFHSLRYCPSFVRSIVIDSCDDDDDDEEEEWTETIDVCDIDEENIEYS